MKRITTLLIGFYALLLLTGTIHADTYTAYGDGTYGSGVYNGSLITEVVNTIVQAVQGAFQRSTTDPPVCGMLQPGINPPTIYAAVPKGSHAIQIYVSPPSEPFDHYVLQFGTESTNLKWGISSLPKDTSAYTIEFLSPNTTYHFQVRGGNGCATGNWSNIMSAKTLAYYNSNKLISDSISVAYKKTEAKKSTEETGEKNQSAAENEESDNAAKESTLNEEQTYTVSVSVVDENGNPLKEATVYIPDESTAAKTDQNGVAVLEGITKGNKKVVVEYGNYTGEQQLAVQGASDRIEIKTNVHSEDTVLSPILLIPIFALLIAGMFYFFRKKKRKKAVKAVL